MKPLLAWALGCLIFANPATEEISFLSPSSLLANEERLYVACATAGKVLVIDLASDSVMGEFHLPDPPGGLALDPGGKFLYVTGATARGRIHKVDLESGRIQSFTAGGHTPVGLVLSPDGGILYVMNRFSNAVSVIETDSGEVRARIPVLREPVAAAETSDGSLLFVANHLPIGAKAEVSVIDTAKKRVVASIPLPNGSTALRSICLSPDGEHAYVTHILARYQLPTTQLERGWMNTNALSIIDVSGMAHLNTVLLDDVDLGAANPWGAACTPDGRYLCVAHAGTHEVSIIDRRKLHKKLDRVERVDEVSSDLSFLVDSRQRFSLTGKGPRGLIVAGNKVYVAEYFSDSIGVKDLDSDRAKGPRSLILGPQTPLTTVRRGEMHFNDANLCFQKWQSCASCHPDGRADSLNWDLLNDGMGNPKNTKSLLLSHETPPVMVSGARDRAETAVRSGIRYIQFAVCPEENAAAIDDYLRSLKPVSSPIQKSEATERGREIFQRAGCAACHPSPLYTDLKAYDVALGRKREKGMAFDTPTLIEVWRTAPYLHDGRATTLTEVLSKNNPSDEHGVTSKLTEQEVEDLAAFVLSR